MPAINLVAVVAAMFAALVLGTVYYMPKSPTGVRWAALLKVPTVMRAPGRAMATQVVLSVLSMVALAVVIQATGSKGAGAGAMVALWIWVIVALADAGNANFSGRPWSLWLINQVNWLVTFLVAGAIIGALA